MTKPLPQTALTPLTANTTTEENLVMNTDIELLSNEALADKISELIDLNTAVVSSLNAGVMTPHEGAALTVTILSGNRLAELLDYFSELRQLDKKQASQLELES